MTSWWFTCALSAVVGLFGVPAARGRAFDAGWFERAHETRRARHERRPNHGGLVLAVGVLVGCVVEGLGADAPRATVAGALIAVLAGWSAERGRGAAWRIPLGWCATAAVVPAFGVRAELTGSSGVDAVLTGLGVLVAIVGISSLDRTDGTGVAVATTAAVGVLWTALVLGDPVAPLAAGLVGVGVGVTSHAWPPGAVRIGAIGPMVLGSALVVVAVELVPTPEAPRSMLFPVLLLLVIGIAAFLPSLDRRLRRRGLPAHLFLVGSGVLGAVGARMVATGDQPGSRTLIGAVLIAGAPALVIALLGLGTRLDEGRRSLGRLVIPAVLVAVVIGGVVAFGALSLRDARNDMERGRVAAVAALALARDGDLDAARARFAQADAAFADASDTLGNPVVRLGGVVPVVAQNLRAARELADVGGDLSGTAVAIADRAGVEDLQVVDGRFPVERASEIAAELGTARDTLRSAIFRLGRTSSNVLLRQIRTAVVDVTDEVTGALDSIDVAAEATRLVPALFGAEGDQRWIVAVLSSSELRGAGGLLGNFAELRISDGKVDLVRPISASQLNQATDLAAQAEVLPPIYTSRYGGFNVPRFWQNLSVTPDVPTMSRAIAAAYPLIPGGGPVDGVLTIDPLGLAKLLAITGPIRVPLWPVPISEDNVVEVLLFEHYAQLEGQAREEFQSIVVGAVVEALSDGALPDPAAFAATLAPAVEGGHLRLWSAQPDGQALFERIGADGTLRRAATGDFVELVTQNGSEAKIDWYLRRSLRYEVAMDPDTGEAAIRATVSITNLAPPSGVSSYIIGEPTGPTRPGVNRIYVTLVTPHRPVGALDAEGAPVAISVGEEQGMSAMTALLEVEPGATVSVTFAAVGLVPVGDLYSLTVGNQTKRVPDEVAVSVVPTEGWKVTSQGGGRATIVGDHPAEFEARFGRR